MKIITEKLFQDLDYLRLFHCSEYFSAENSDTEKPHESFDYLQTVTK